MARLRYVQGPVSFQPAGDSDWVAAALNRPTTTGDRLWTDSGARAELGIGSATIRLAGRTGFSFLNLDDRTVQIQLTEGVLGIRVRRLLRDEVFEVDTPNQAFTILRPGQYRIEASEDGATTFVTVRDGEGEATGGGETYTVASGASATFTGMDPLRAEVAAAGAPDEFDDWGQRRDRHDDRVRSARYVSPDVVGYEDLDDYGTWRADARYGNVWVPRVAYGWAPYREGHWAWISPWGWTWVDDEAWGYAPFHYGRWVNLGGSWAWVPGPVAVEPVYAPALVAFVGGPGLGLSVSVGGGYAGNVAWFPLGPREVYVPAYQVSPAYVNRVNVSNTTVSTTTITTVYNTQVTNNYSTTNVTYVNKTVPGGVTAVPHGVFTSAQPVARAAVAVNAQQVTAAPVGARAALAPTRESVLGVHASTAGSAARPPAAVANRPVVAKVSPPPPPVPFSRQREALAAHPGQPLARHEVETLRPAERAAVQPLVRQAPPGKPAAPANQATAGRPAKPGAGQPVAPAGQTQEMHAARPPAPSAPPQPGNRPEPAAGLGPGQPPRPQAKSAPPGKPLEQAARPPPAAPSAPPQPGNRPEPAAGLGPGQPPKPQASSTPPGKPQELHAARPPSAAPSARPQPGNRPGPTAGPGSDQPPRPQAPSAPPGKSQEMRSDRPPTAQPGRPPPAAEAAKRPSPQADKPRQPGPQRPAEHGRREQENP